MRGAVKQVLACVMRRPVLLFALAVFFVAVPVPSPAEADVIFQVPEVLVRHAAVPKPVGTGKPAPPLNNSDPWHDSEHVQQRYEYFVEHAVSTADARKMAMMLKVSEIPETPPGCGKCSKREMEYCETKLLADHCCCERHFVPDPFPWLPHTCYIGPERCTPIAKNCAQYARLRDCCCMRPLAQQWQTILSKSPSITPSGISLMVLTIFVITFCL